MLACRRVFNATVVPATRQRLSNARTVCAAAAARYSSSFKPSEDVPAGAPALLFTPGPLTTSNTVKQAMLQDLGTRDKGIVTVIKEILQGILETANVSKEAGYESIIVQGSGTMAVEATIGSVVQREGTKLLVVVNGHYGSRMREMARYFGINCVTVDFSEREAATVEGVMDAVKADSSITHVAMVHHETTSGALSPVGDIGMQLKAHNPDLTFIVDSMSAFGAYPVEMEKWGIDYLVSSANKCIEGVPGFAFVIAKRSSLEASEGSARSLSFDLHDQWKGLTASGHFRFTPPVQAMLAFRQALREHKAEGGSAARLARYEANYETLRKGMAKLGFTPYVSDEHQGAIISTFLFPDDPNFDLPKLYNGLADRGMIIYPGKVTQAECFRIGSIGRLYPHNMEALVHAVEDELRGMGVALPVTQHTS